MRQPRYVNDDIKRDNYTFTLHSCFLLVDIYQFILNVRKPSHHFCRISWIIWRSCQKLIVGRWWRNHLKAEKITKQQKWPAAVWKVNRTTLFTANLSLHLSLLWVYKTIIGFGLRIISRIIQTSVNVIRLRPSASADNIDLGLDNFWYHAQPNPIIVY